LRLLPEIKHRLHDPPRVLHEVGTRKERWIAVESTVEEHFVASATGGLEGLGVVKTHAGPLEQKRRAGPLGENSNLDSLKRLDVKEKQIRFGVAAWLRFELHDNFSAPLPERFSRSQVDRHTGPAFVVDVKFEGGVGGSIRDWINVWLLPVPQRFSGTAGGEAVGLLTSPILPTHAVLCGLAVAQQPHRTEQARFFLSHHSRMGASRTLRAAWVCVNKWGLNLVMGKRVEV